MYVNKKSYIKAFKLMKFGLSSKELKSYLWKEKKQITQSHNARSQNVRH